MKKILQLLPGEHGYTSTKNLVADDKKQPWIDPESNMSSNLTDSHPLKVMSTQDGYTLINYLATLPINKLPMELDIDNIQTNKWLPVTEPKALPDECVILQKVITELEIGEHGHIQDSAITKLEDNSFVIDSNTVVELSPYFPAAATVVHVERLDDLRYQAKLCQYQTETGAIEHYCSRAIEQDWPDEFVATCLPGYI